MRCAGESGAARADAGGATTAGLADAGGAPVARRLGTKVAAETAFGGKISQSLRPRAGSMPLPVTSASAADRSEAAPRLPSGYGEVRRTPRCGVQSS